MNSAGCSQPDNSQFDDLSESWWGEKGVGALVRYFSNPWRVPYFREILKQRAEIATPSSRLLDVGCGGGMLAEEFARMGFAVTGLDPSRKMLDVARAHAAQSGLQINYREGYGHELPFEDETFEVVSCCDMLEHVRNWDAVISEIERVLKHQGIFIFDTINRTAVSKLFLIKIAQEWRFTRYLPPQLHAWEMFVTPEELKLSLTKHGLQPKEFVGTKPKSSPLRGLVAIRRYHKGRISTAEFAEKVAVEQGPDVASLYMGYAVKP